MSTTVEPLPHLRFEIPEAARILCISRNALRADSRRIDHHAERRPPHVHHRCGIAALCHSGIVTIVRVAGLALKMPLAPRQSDAGRRRSPVDHDSRFFAFKTR